MVLAGLLLLAGFGCARDDRDSDSFAVYHLETAISGPVEDGELRCGPPRPVCPFVVRQPPPRVFRYTVEEAPAVTAGGIVRSSARSASDPSTGAPVVIVELTAEGREGLGRLTREVARFGARDQGWHHVAVVVGDEIVAFPEIDFDAYPDGIPDAPGIQIAAAGEADARDLVRRLRGG